MEITLLGAVVLPLGLYWAVMRPSWLYYSVVFFVPFSASAVVNVQVGSVAFGLQPYQYMGLLLLVRKSLDLFHGQAKLLKEQLVAVLPLFLFLATAVTSLCVGALRGSNLTAFNITQLIYLVFGVLLALAITLDTTSSKLPLAVHVYLWSITFVSLWGLFQAASHYAGIPYPSFLFNNSISKATQGYTGVLTELGAKRISSVAVEPSILARVLLASVALLTAWMVRSRLTLSRVGQCLLILTTLFLSTSSTSFVGLAFLLIVAPFYFVRKIIKIVVIYSSLMVGGVCAWAFLPGVRQVVLFLTFDKVSTGSYQERSQSILDSFDHFLANPIFGAGWGNVLSHDLVINLLSNVGIVGFASFTLFVTTMFWTSNRGRKRASNGDGSTLWIVEGLQLALGCILVTDLMAGFGYVFGHFWVFSGLLIGSLRACPVSHARRNDGLSWPQVVTTTHGAMHANLYSVQKGDHL